MTGPSYRARDPIPGTQYRFVRELGAGGHGCVYEVEHTFLEAPAVMKLLHAELVGREDIAARMTREARTLAKLRHPNVVEVRDGGITAEAMPRPYFVMEQLNGMALREMLKKTRRGLGVLPALRIVTDILVGLDHAHNAGVVHRDIKPDNVYLHRTPSGITIAKVLDFGIAHLLLGQRYTGRFFLGTPRYAAPEQLLGETPTARTDIYAAGLVLYELLTGEMPFAKIKDVPALLNAHVNDALPKPSLIAADVPLSLDKFLATMLAKDPAERPPTAFAAAVALREIRGKYESEQSSSMLSPEYKTEPSPMEDVLYAASPDNPPIVTEVAPPLGISDTTPDSEPAMAGLRAALDKGKDASTTALSPPTHGAPAPRPQQVRTVPMAAPIGADRTATSDADTSRDHGVGPRAKPVVARDARTNTAREPAAVVRAGPNDTTPMADVSAGLADTTPASAAVRDEADSARGQERGSTTSTPLIVGRRADVRDAAPRGEAKARARRRTFVAKVMAVAAVLGGAAVALTTIALRGPRTVATPSPEPRASAVALPSASSPIALALVPVPSTSVPRPDAEPAQSAAVIATPAPSIARKKTMPRAAAPLAPSAVPFE